MSKTALNIVLRLESYRTVETFDVTRKQATDRRDYKWEVFVNLVRNWLDKIHKMLRFRWDECVGGCFLCSVPKRGFGFG